jgi:Ca-activated chloride channel family protein
MTKPLPILTDQEVTRSAPVEEESSFGSLATARGHLPLKAMDVQGKIDGLFALIELGQTFVNTLDEPLEATYVFPLPDRAAVTRFRMEVAGRVIEGVLKERAAARQEYEQAIEAGHRAAITEEERPGVFTMRVGNLMPGEEAVVHLTLIQPLPYDDGEATLRFPLVVAPRYIPGKPLSEASVGDGVIPDTDAVPDASRITPPVLLPGYPNPVRLALAVEIAPSQLCPREFRSSLHAVLEEEREGVRRIALKPGERLNRDFILRFRVGTDAIKTALSLRPDAEGDEGTFALTVVSPTERVSASRPREVVFILDRSGSMGGWKIVAARRAIGRMVDTLTDHDRFTVYAFDDVVETPAQFSGQGLVPANNRNRFRAVEFLARMDARGGTEMAHPLDLAVSELASAARERDRILILVTDGQVGNEDQILRTLGKRLENLRIFTLGIDRAVNEGFLKRLAALGGGCSEIVESEDRLDEVMDRVHRRIGTPVLTGLRLEPAGLHLQKDSIVPGRMPHLFSGAPLCITGRYRGNQTGSITLQAVDVAGQPWLETTQAQMSTNPAISGLWARGHIRELEDRYTLGHPELEQRIVDTSLKFGVLCRFTAFVAVDKSEIVNEGGTIHRVIQPVEAPEGWAMLNTFFGAAGYHSAESLDACLQSFTHGAGAMASGELRARSLASFYKMKLPGARRRPKRTGTQASEPLDLAPYRKRAAELLHELNKSVATEPSAVKGLGVLAVKLATLIEDLRSIGAADSDIRPLQELHDELKKFVAETDPSQQQAVQLVRKSEQVLEAFVLGAAIGVKRRRSFWK